MEPTARGDPESPLRWTCKSTRNLAEALTKAGHPVSAQVVAELLGALGYSLQATSKQVEGSAHPDRNAQFGYINDLATEHLGVAQPVISVDAKKKELVGNYANRGTDNGSPRASPCGRSPRLHRPDSVGKAIPYGVYDVATDEGWVGVGADHDTAAFVVATIGRWWEDGRARRLPESQAAADNRRRRRLQQLPVRLWKAELAKLASAAGLDIPCAISRLAPPSGTRSSTACSATFHELAGPAPDQPRGGRRPHRRHDHVDGG